MLPEYGQFAAVARDVGLYRNQLSDLVAAGERVALVEEDEVSPPPGLIVAGYEHGLQMVLSMPIDTPPTCTLCLEDDDIPEMLRLVGGGEQALFMPKSRLPGRFVSIRRDGELVAIGGERMRPEGYAEIANLFTHPAYRGHGFATALLRKLSVEIQARGETPFLHVTASNESAIAVYQALGFVIRRQMTMTLLTRNPTP
jgi:GNAT superfamily N-acetyltransferase